MRIRIPVSVSDPEAKVTMEPLCPPERHGGMIQDTCVNPSRVGRPYRYCYGNCIRGPRPCNSVNAVCRVDMTDGSVLMWSDSPNMIPAGPPTFLSRPGADPEDETDGVLLLDCLAADGCATFLVLDGRTFAEVARCVLPYRHVCTYNNAWMWDAAPAA